MISKLRCQGRKRKKIRRTRDLRTTFSLGRVNLPVNLKKRCKLINSIDVRRRERISKR